MRLVLETEDAALIQDIKALLQERKDDVFDELTPEAQQDVLDGIGHADRGEVVSHSQAVHLLGKWGLK